MGRPEKGGAPPAQLADDDEGEDEEWKELNPFDEDELEAELNDLEEEGELEEQQELEKQLLDIEPAKLPEVPSAEPPAAAKAKPQKVVEEEDPDMAELAAWAS